MRFVNLILLAVWWIGGTYAQDFQVSETGDAHFRPAIAADSVGNFVVVWSDARNSIENGGLDSGDAIYGQRFSAGGLPIGANFRVSEASLAGGNWIPSISMNKRGDFVVAWQGWGAGRILGDIDVYARRYSNDGLPIGPSFRVSDDSGTSAQGDARVLLRSNGSFVITWFDRREGPLFSYAQLYDSAGIPRGGNFRVNSNSVSALASLGGFEDGRFFFMWAGYLQLYRSDGTPESSLVNTGVDGLPFGLGRDTLLIVWRPPPLLNVIYLRLVSTNGISLSDSLRIDDDSLFQPKGAMTIAYSQSKGVVIVWRDHRHDPLGIIADGDIYAQRYDRWLAPIGKNFKVNHEDEERAQRNPAAVFSGNNFVTVWLDNQTPERCPPLPPDYVDLGSVIANIVGTIQPYDNPEAGEVFGWRTKKSKCPPPSQFALHQNYPNPFNLETIISVDLPVNSFVDITVYDLLGRPIQRLVHDTFLSGQYRTVFKAAGLSSGIYFYRLTTDRFSHTRKMILIK